MTRNHSENTNLH